jgi:hypothetical protein
VTDLPGSIPSVLGECTGARIVTPLMVTLLLNTGHAKVSTMDS